MQIAATDAKIRNGKGFGVQNLRQLHRSSQGHTLCKCTPGQEQKNWVYKLYWEGRVEVFEWLICEVSLYIVGND